MNYIEQIKEFWRSHDVEVYPSNVIALYFYLLEVNNKTSWVASFKRNNSKICADLGISYPTLCNARNKLKQTGFISFKSENGNANVTYTLKNFLKVTNEVAVEVTNEVDSEVSSRLLMTKDKLKTKTKTIFLLEKETKERKEKFSAPSLLEVQEFILEKKYGVNPQSFWNFYQSKNWMVGKNKMQNWKMAVAGWESRDKDKSNQNGTGAKKYSRNR